jgi:hypothetical protein
VPPLRPERSLFFHALALLAHRALIAGAAARRLDGRRRESGFDASTGSRVLRTRTAAGANTGASGTGSWTARALTRNHGLPGADGAAINRLTGNR